MWFGNGLKQQSNPWLKEGCQIDPYGYCHFRHTGYNGSVFCANNNKEIVILVQVLVRFNNVDYALKTLKKKMQLEGVFRSMRMNRAFEKPSEAKVRKQAESLRRRRKLDRRRHDY